MATSTDYPNYHNFKVNCSHHWAPMRGNWQICMFLGSSHSPSNHPKYGFALAEAVMDDFGSLIVVRDWV
jgi:hypothetical protein